MKVANFVQKWKQAQLQTIYEPFFAEFYLASPCSFSEFMNILADFTQYSCLLHFLDARSCQRCVSKVEKLVKMLHVKSTKKTCENDEFQK